MGIKIIQSFAKGDEVPHWLIDVEPDSPHSRRGKVTFGFDCHVAEVTMGFVVVPDSEVGLPFAYKISDADRVTLFAATRTIYTPLTFMVTGGREDDRDPGGEPSPVAPLDRITA